LKATGSLSVALRAEPGDLAVSVHPIINVGLALETGDFSWFGAWVLSDDSPVIIRVTNGFEGHFGFCHAALCRQCPQKRTRLAAGLRALRSRLLFEAVDAPNVVAAFEAPAVVAGLDDVAMVGQAVERRGRHLGVAAGGTVLALAIIPPAPAADALTGAAKKPEAILGLIAAHSAAIAATDDAMRHYDEMEQTIPDDRRKDDFFGGKVDEVATDDPRWTAACHRFNASFRKSGPSA
jgi:hypothetical protein